MALGPLAAALFAWPLAPGRGSRILAVACSGVSCGGLLAYRGRCLLVGDFAKHAARGNRVTPPPRRLRLLLLPWGALLELGCLALAWCVVWVAPRAAAALHTWVAQSLPGLDWYIGRSNK